MKKVLFVSAVALMALSAQGGSIVFEKADKNGDGILTLEEFVAQHAIVSPEIDSETITKWFQGKDKDKDGLVSRAEFEAARKK